MFSEEIINQVWNKARIEPGYNPNIWRKDFAGAWIRYDYYGKTIEYGWEIDHLRPLIIGGTDSLNNLNAIHWRNNRRKGDDYPNFYTSITSRDNKNVELLQSWRAR